MPYVNVNNINLYYEIHGSGPPLMLIAGLGSDSQSWVPVIEELAEHFTLILPDNRGCGRTTPHEVELSIQKMGDDCVSLISELRYDSVAVLGHSMGGYIAQDCAIRYPDKISKLILAGTFPYSPARNNMLLNEFKRYLQTDMDKEQWYRSLFYWLYTPDFFEDNNAAFANQINAIKDFDCRSELGSIRHETLILHGGEDLLFTVNECISQLQLIPNAAIHVIEKAAHSFQTEYPEQLTECVLKFLK